MDIDCQVFDEKDPSTRFEFAPSGRAFASFIKLNQSAMWITGGFNHFWQDLMSTVIVTVNGSVSDVNLPISFHSHCMVHYKPSSILIIGGTQDGVEKSKKTWIVDANNRSSLKEGPSLNKGRQHFSCNKVEDHFGHSLILVVGGEDEDTVEILNTTEMKGWTFGKRNCSKIIEFELIQIHFFCIYCRSKITL